MGARGRAWIEAGAGLALSAGLWWTAAETDPARPAPLAAPAASRLWEEATSAREAEDPARSLAAVERLLASFPHEPRYLGFEAETLERLGRPRDAARAWELYAKSAPFPTEACPQLGRDYEKAGLPDAALDAHRRCLAMDPSKTDLMVYLADALLAAGRDDEAGGLFSEAARRSPEDPDATLGAVRLALKRGDPEAADARLRPILASSPKNCDVLLADGQVALAKNEAARARESLTRAAAACPRYEDAYRLLLRAQNALGDAEGARRTRARLAELEAEDGDRP